MHPSTPPVAGRAVDPAVGPARSVGTAAPEFAAVRELFDTFLAEDPEYSAQLAVYRAGTKVLDLCGGPGLRSGDITGTYSCSKGAAAFVIALLVQDGQLDLDATMASYWPEFGAHGKSGLTVRQALSTRRGCRESRAASPWRSSRRRRPPDVWLPPPPPGAPEARSATTH